MRPKAVKSASTSGKSSSVLPVNSYRCSQGSSAPAASAPGRPLLWLFCLSQNSAVDELSTPSRCRCSSSLAPSGSLITGADRSEERRVGKEGRTGGTPTARRNKKKRIGSKRLRTDEYEA